MTMASMQTISNLHQQAPERAPVKTDNLADLQPGGAYAFGTRRAQVGRSRCIGAFHSPRRSRNDLRPYEQRAAECSGRIDPTLSPAWRRAITQPMRFRAGCGPLAGATGPDAAAPVTSRGRWRFKFKVCSDVGKTFRGRLGDRN